MNMRKPGNFYRASDINKRRMSFFSALMILSLTATSTCFAGFEVGDFGTRSLGLGRAYTAMAGDGEALSYNIAGLARTPNNLLFSSYANLFGGMSEGSLNQYSAGAIYNGLPIVGRLGAGISVFTTQGYQEIQVPVGTSFELPFGIAAGVALRGLYWGITPDVDPVTGVQDDALSKFTFTADAGLYYDIDLTTLKLPLGLATKGKIALGLAIKNLIPLSVAVDKDQADAGRLPVQPRAGIAWIGNGGLISVDYLLYNGGQVRAGGEFKALNIDNRLGRAEILIRAGAAGAADSGGGEVTGGFGIRFNQFRLDAAYVWSQNILDAGATQRYSLSYEF